MAENQGTSPIAKAGILVNNDWKDYPSPQDYYNAIAAALEISVEAGETGEKGDPGDDASGSLPVYGMVLEQELDIPSAVAEFNTGTDLTGKILQIRAPQGHGTNDEEAFGVGVIEGQVVHFVFNQDEGAQIVAREGWVLEIWGIGDTNA